MITSSELLDLVGPYMRPDDVLLNLATTTSSDATTSPPPQNDEGSNGDHSSITAAYIEQCAMQYTTSVWQCIAPVDGLLRVQCKIEEGEEESTGCACDASLELPTEAAAEALFRAKHVATVRKILGNAIARGGALRTVIVDVVRSFLANVGEAKLVLLLPAYDPLTLVVPDALNNEEQRILRWPLETPLEVQGRRRAKAGSQDRISPCVAQSMANGMPPSVKCALRYHDLVAFSCNATTSADMLHELLNAWAAEQGFHDLAPQDAAVFPTACCEQHCVQRWCVRLGTKEETNCEEVEAVCPRQHQMPRKTQLVCWLSQEGDEEKNSAAAMPSADQLEVLLGATAEDVRKEPPTLHVVADTKHNTSLVSDDVYHQLAQHPLFQDWAIATPPPTTISCTSAITGPLFPYLKGFPSSDSDEECTRAPELVDEQDEPRTQKDLLRKAVTAIDFSRSVNMKVLEMYSTKKFEELETVELPPYLEAIEDEAFFNSPKLKHMTAFSSLQQYEYFGEYALARCEAIQSIRLPPSVERLKYSCFYSCLNLKLVDLSACDAMEELPKSAFVNCHKLHTVRLPRNITSIGTDCFCHCDSLTTIDIDQCKKLTTLGGAAFMFCSKLAVVSIPSSIRSIGDLCFKQCHALKMIISSDTIKVYKQEGTKIELGNQWCEQTLLNAMKRDGVKLQDMNKAGCHVM